MKPHARLKMLSAVTGGAAVVGMAVVGVSLGHPWEWVGPAPATVLAPATGQMTDDGSEMTTTTTAASFRPTITASIPPPPD